MTLQYCSESVMLEFYDVVKNEMPDNSIFNIHGFEKINPETHLERFVKNFNLDIK